MRVAGVERGRDTEKSNLFVRLWRDDCGALLALEWVVLATIMVIGIMTGLTAVRQGVIAELHDVANAVLGLDQSYGLTGQETGCGAGAPAAHDPLGTTKADVVRDQAVRVGMAEKHDNLGFKGSANDTNRGGLQAFTAGSGFLEGRHLDGKADGIAAHSTAATGTVKKTKGCD
jgi:hypothetical protein